MSGFGNIQPRTGSKDSVRLEEVIKMHKWPADEWSQVRFMPGKILPIKRHWISIIAGKDKKEITIPRYCLAFDVNNENAPRTMENPNYKKGSTKKSEKDKIIPIPCPYCTLAHGQDASARYEFFYLANAIIREVQEDMPARAKKIERTKEEKKTGFKDIRSKSWTPVEVCRITSTVANRIKELGDGNFVKKGGEKKAFDVTHEKYGIDIRVKYKPKASGTEKYSADKDDRTPLTDDEKGYLTWRLDESLVEVTGRTELAQALEDFKRMEVVGANDVDDDEDGYSLGDDDGKKKKKKDGKKKKPAFSDDDDDDDEDDKPKKGKKSKKSKSDDDDDDDEDDKPKKGKKKKPAFSDDDDDDEDDEPKKSSKKSKSKDKVKKSSKKDDEKPAKKKKAKKDDEPKKKKKSSDDKKSKSKDKKADKPSSKKKGKKKSAWDDDDE